MAASQRPRPRARKASTDAPSVSPINDVQHEIIKVPSPLLPIPRDDSDDDDDFFTRRRTLNGHKAISAPTLLLGEGLSSQDIDIVESSSAEDDDQDTVKSSDDEDSRKRKKIRTKLPSWTKSSSLSKLEAASKLPCSSRLSVEVISSTDSENQPLVKKVRREVKNVEEEEKDDEYDEEMGSPPKVQDEMMEKLRIVLDQHNGPSLTEIMGDDEDDSILKELQKPSDLDPDLIRMMKTDRAREARKMAKDLEARRRSEEERAKKASQSRMSANLSQDVQQSQSKTEVIEVEDSDDEDWRARPIRRNAASSSPVQMVSPPPPRRREAEPTSYQARADEPEEAAVEETERIGVIMKGGDGGTLTALVRVKPTTQMKKLLDHYIETHKESIPAGKRKSVKFRFDGEWISPTSTVGDVGIEDDEQIDVIW